MEELVFVNNSSENVNIRIYPVSVVFNGDFECNLKARKRSNPQNLYNKCDYISGIYRDRYDTLHNNFTLYASDTTKGLEYDPDDGQVGNVFGIFSYGRYKISLTNAYLDSIILETDVSDLYGDLQIFFYNDSLVYLWGAAELRVKLTSSSYTIQNWKPLGSSQNTQKNFGNFVYATGTIANPNPYTIFPQDSRRDCNVILGGINQNNVFNDARNGKLISYLSIDKNVFTPDSSQMIDFPTRVNVSEGAHLELDTGRTLNFTEVVSNISNSFFEMNVEINSALILRANSEIIVRKKNRLILANNSKLYLGSNAKITILQGGIFCNYGASIRGNGSIVYKGGTIYFAQCGILDNYEIRDSAKIILDSNAVWEIPDSTNLRFTGNKTGLIMKYGSKIKLGENSKIIIDSGATLIANNAEFSSSDTSKKWEGIVLSNSGVDSIINCTFSNAKTALSITNNADYSRTNRVIKNNTFNIPYGGISKGIYGENNYRILIQNNIFNMPVYFPSGSPVLFIYVGLYLKNNSTGGA
ncbi:MAG: hypothetical protein ABI462_03945, partial [Ignavibacteria bacterium]